MVTLSAIIIAKNSQDIIEGCIESVKFCDEIIVVDGGSTDDTNQVAKKLGAKIIKGVELDFSKQREIGMRAATGTWLFYIDTDERVTEELKDEILSATKTSKASYAGYTIKRQNFYLGNHPWPVIETLGRLFKATALVGWHGQLHETAIINGEVGELEGYLYHYTHQDLTSMVAKTIVWSDIEATLRFDAHHPQMSWWRFFRVMLTTWWTYYVVQEGFRVGTAGVIESMYQSFSMFVTYAKLWEMQQSKRV